MVVFMRTKQPAILFLFALIFGFSAFASDFRTFESSDGRSMEAKIVSLDSNQKVSLKLANGQSYQGVGMTMFSVED
tara:strand:- start:1504 stop:1731 length:228 start_codon:yes stop_codon:yes gene_type:complete